MFSASMHQPVYLDHNATTPAKPQVVALMVEALAHVGNASSIHALGRAARSKVERARAQVAALVKADPAQVIFNSGATEGNNTVLNSFTGQKVAVGSTEHPSVREKVPEASVLPVHSSGLLDFERVAELLAAETPALVSVMMVNNETGVVQDVARLAALCHQYHTKVHVDAVQAAGRVPLVFDALGADYLTLSAHKMGGPQGVGALVVHPKAPPVRLLAGGGQEKRQRAGTENVAGIAGFGLAAELAAQDMAVYQRLAALRDSMENTLHHALPALHVFGKEAPRVANTSCFALKGVDAQTQLIALDLAGFCVSSGSACSSGTVKESHVLRAMHAAPELATSALRVSFGWSTQEDDILRFTQTYLNLAKGWACQK